MSSHVNGVSSNDLHIISARGQYDRAIVGVNKTKDEGLVQIVKHSLKLVMEEIDSDPRKQENFKELLMQKTMEIIGGMSDSGRQKEILGQVAKIGQAVMQYNVIQATGISPMRELSTPSPHLKQYHMGMEIPDCVLSFDPKAKHTIPLGAYLDARISGPIQDLVKQGTPIDLFVGPIEDMEPYYFHNGNYTHTHTLNTRSSIKYLLFEDDKGFQKIVIAGISNESKFTHTLLQLKAVGVPLEQISVKGDIQFCAEIFQDKLYKKFQQAVGDKPIALAVMGNRSGMVLEVAHRLYPDKMKGPFKTADEEEKKAVQLLKANNNYKEVDIDGIFKFSTIDVMIDGKPQALVSFRMPNGDLSRIATRLLLDKHEVGGFVMVGAGGSLKKDSAVGSYQVTTTSQLDGKKPVKIDERRIMPLNFCERSFCSLSNTNLTVLSPLVETADWLDDVRQKVQSVDVETYFIMEALSAALKAESCKTQVIPGVFISDEVGGDHPLTEKIDPANAWGKLPMLLNQSLTYFKVEDNRPKVEEVPESDALEKQVDSSHQTVVNSAPQNNSSWSWGTVFAVAAVATVALLGGIAIGKNLRK
ncbi:hypothetical protein [Simkania negevensis]|uniref:hypothetical protein n=1 Tax=Simkania negevensis TaxID=83561 RepID=UPI00059BCC2E|nr:hypothetical protein [Simkania negevensis]